VLFASVFINVVNGREVFATLLLVLRDFLWIDAYYIITLPS